MPVPVNEHIARSPHHMSAPLQCVVLRLVMMGEGRGMACRTSERGSSMRALFACTCAVGGMFGRLGVSCILYFDQIAWDGAYCADGGAVCWARGARSRRRTGCSSSGPWGGRASRRLDVRRAAWPAPPACQSIFVNSADAFDLDLIGSFLKRECEGQTAHDEWLPCLRRHGRQCALPLRLMRACL